MQIDALVCFFVVRIAQKLSKFLLISAWRIGKFWVIMPALLLGRIFIMSLLYRFPDAANSAPKCAPPECYRIG